MQREATTRNAFQNDGFYVHRQQLFPDDLIAGAVAGMDAIREGQYDTGTPPFESPWNPGDDPNKLCKIEMPQIASYGIRELLNYPALGQLAGEITGADWVQIWWVQLLYKPPMVSQSAAPTVGWHQDWQYWQNSWDDGSELFTAWIALSDVTEEAGPMRFVTGSQKWGLMDGDFFGNFTEQKIAAPEGETWEEVSGALPVGGVSFHDKLVFHGSGPNVSTGPRRSFAVHMRTNRSAPREPEKREGLTLYLDNHDNGPIIYGSK
jgi:hypothetical protein